MGQGEGSPLVWKGVYNSTAKCEFEALDMRSQLEKEGKDAIPEKGITCVIGLGR